MPDWSNVTLHWCTITFKACFMCCIVLCLNVYLCTKLNMGCAIVCDWNKYQHCFNQYRNWHRIFCPSLPASVCRLDCQNIDKPWVLIYCFSNTHVTHHRREKINCNIDWKSLVSGRHGNCRQFELANISNEVVKL